MRSQILQVLFVIGSSLAIYVHEECEARSTWEIPYNWTDINLSVWVPPSEKSIFLSLEIEFEGHVFPIVYDSMELSRDKIYMHLSRDGSPNSTEYNMTELIAEGWADFKFTSNSHYGMMYISNNAILPVRSSVEYLPKLIRLKGSNITLNCPSGQRMWKISNLPVHVPFNSKHRLSLFSTREFLPLFSVDMRSFLVGWDNGLTTVPSRAKPLPPFEEHNITITCLNEDSFRCIIQVGENASVEEDFPVGSEPQSIAIKSKQGEAFILILHEEENGISQLFCHESGSWSYYLHITESVLLAILLPVSSLLIIFITRRKNMYKEWYLRNVKITVQTGEHQHDSLLKRTLKKPLNVPGSFKRVQKKSMKR